MKSIMQNDLSKCYLCGRNGATDPLELHHVMSGTANRRLSDRDGLVVRLCGDICHRNGKQAVHRCKATADRLKAEGQRAWMEKNGGSVEAFRARYGKSYL